MKRKIPMIALVSVWSWMLAGCGGADMGPEYPEMEGEVADDDHDPDVPSLPSDELIEAEYGETEPPAAQEVAAAEEPVLAPEPEPEPEPPAAEEPPEPKPIEGVIVSRSGNTVVISTQAEPPDVGQKGILYKWFEQNLFGMLATGWLDIAAVTVKKVAGNKVTLTIDEEHSETEINGKKVNHFKKSNKAKLDVQ